MRATLEVEQDEQRRWKLRPRFSGVTVFDTLVANEFLTDDERRLRRQNALSAILRFSTNQVPYYKNLFSRLALKRGSVPQPDELSRIPALAKDAIRRNEPRLTPDRLPEGEKAGRPLFTSGTTSPKMRIEHSARSHLMWNLISQRSRRWFRFDPEGTAAAVRSSSILPRRPNGTLVPDGETVQISTWPRSGIYFVTGPALGFAKTNSIAQIADWLEHHRPDYFQADSAILEHLALEFQTHPPLRSVRGLKAVSEPLTAGRRARVETIFGAPISISYGLNEIGVVASCCPEAGRYHVHDEHCLVEIVDADGQPSPPGEYGRVYVTSLTNYAMPLIRYDTGDIAQALDGPCPCGRTLPSFGQIQGRRSRIDPVPREVMALADTILEAVARLPADLSRNLRMYQLHYSQNGNFELRTVVAGSLPPAFDAQIAEIWRTAVASNPIDLRVVTVENIRPAPSDKFFHFDSDLFL